MSQRFEPPTRPLVGPIQGPTYLGRDETITVVGPGLSARRAFRRAAAR